MIKLDIESKTWLFGLMSYARVGDLVLFKVLGGSVYARTGSTKWLFGIVFGEEH